MRLRRRAAAGPLQSLLRMKPRPDPPPGPYLIVGLARSGTAAARALRARGERVIGVDRAIPVGVGEAAGGGLDRGIAAADELAAMGVELHAESDGLALLERVRTLVKSPGVPAQAPVVAAARAGGLTVMGELELAWRMLPNELIAVTGTNGKTTTVELIGHVHRQAGLPVAVAGNVGAALSGLVGQVRPQATIVCETSSFQLEDTIAFAPEAAALLNIAPDHLDRHGTLERYAAAKLQIFARQGAGDVAVAPAGLPIPEVGRARRIAFGRCGSSGPPGAGAANRIGFGAGEPRLCERGGDLWWGDGSLMPVGELRLRGAHNLQNAMAAAAVCLARGLDPDAVVAGLRSFPGVAHRLEELATLGGVLYVNDSKATNVASTLVALDAMASDGLPVHLILGGLGKGQDFAPLAPAVARACRAAYLIGQDAPLVERALSSTDVAVSECGDLELALAQARSAAREGDVVLLSPACASFDQFVDFEARGERFRELVVGGFQGPASK